MHGASPYLGFGFSDAPEAINFQLFSDPACNLRSPVKIELSIDPYASLGKIVMRYRLILASWPLGIVALALRIQLKAYYGGGRFYFSFFFLSFDFMHAIDFGNQINLLDSGRPCPGSSSNPSFRCAVWSP
jgi:hypothetical protein